MDRYISDAQSIKAVIEGAQTGDVIYLPDATIEIAETIQVQSGIRIMGQKNTVISASSLSLQSVFDVSGKSDIAISDIAFEISGEVSAVYGLQSSNIKVSSLIIGGDIDRRDALNGSPGVVNFQQSNDIEVLKNVIYNTYGGIYAIDCGDVRLSDNKLSDVNYGQFVVSGEDIEISGNDVFKAGIGNSQGSVSYQGDCITILGAKNLLVSDNNFDTGYCYLISFSQGNSDNIQIKENTFYNGITHAVYSYEDTSIRSIDISGNEFVNNSGSAIAFSGSVDDIIVERNRFVDDGILFTSKVTGATIRGNDGLVMDGVPSTLSYEEILRGSYLFGNVDGKISSGFFREDDQALSTEGKSLVITITAVVGSVIKLEDHLPVPSGTSTVQIVDPDLNDRSSSVMVNGLAKGGLSTMTTDEFDKSFLHIGNNSYSETLFFRTLIGQDWSPWRNISVLVRHEDVSNDNIYDVQMPNDIIREIDDGGVDTVFSEALWYVLPDNVENLVLKAGAQFGFGNELGNTIWGSAGDNVLSGNAGSDLLYGRGGDDAITGGNDADRLYGDEGDDDLQGGAGNDELYGGSGADRLDGGTGDDLLAGGEGNDVYVAQALDRIVEAAGHGYDSLFVSTDYVLAADAEIETIVVAASHTSVSGSDYANTIVTAGLDSTIYGRGGNDVITGGAGTDRLYGDEGDDDLQGGAGNDELYGGSGADRLDGGTGDDLLAGGEGNDVYVAQALDRIVEAAGHGYDSLFVSTDYVLAADAEIETIVVAASHTSVSGSDYANTIVTAGLDSTIYGRGGNDVITGGAGADRLYGDQGDDDLQGGAGNDELYGGSGADRLEGGAGDDLLAGGEGNDVYVADALDRIVEAAGHGYDSLFVSTDYVLAADAEIETIVVAASNTSVSGSDYANTIVTAGLDSTIYGRGGNDVITGGVGADRLDGGAGDDVLRGGAGSDELYGGSGADRLDGGAGDDLLAGGEGNDVYVAQALDRIVEAAGQGNDRLFVVTDYVLAADAEIETIVVAASNTSVSGSDYANTIVTAGLNSTIYGRGGNDVITGGAGADRLYGDQGDDDLQGGAGSDELYGGSGADRLDGGAGDDTMTGGSGIDRFLFARGGGNDVITDFQGGAGAGDVIELKRMGFANFADVQASAFQVMDDVRIVLGSGDTLVLLNVQLATLNADDFLFL